MIDMQDDLLDEARERLLDQVFGAKDLKDVAESKEALRQWLRVHPEEQGMRDGFEALSHRHDYLEAQGTEPAAASRKAPLAEAAA